LSVLALHGTGLVLIGGKKRRRNWQKPSTKENTMKNLTNKMLPIVAMISAMALVLACGGMEPEDSVAGIEEALELEDGGYDMGDELPQFGLPDLDDLDIDIAGMDIPEEQGLDEFLGLKPPASGKKLPPPCPHGYLKGVWKPIAKGKPLGVFKGKWVTANGKVHGHLKGIYGKNKLGHGIFFGKYIDKTGKFKGLLKGHYGNGFFKGRWHGVKGGLGGMHGVYGKNVFKGKWTAFCNAKCNSVCKPGYKRALIGCYCVPANVVPCKKGQCPKGMKCDPCPKPAKCKLPGVKCPAVCAPPVCRALPKPKAQPQQGTQVK